ncbi:hypothetical protein D3C86_1940640 [compost metagenome]
MLGQAINIVLLARQQVATVAELLARHVEFRALGGGGGGGRPHAVAARHFHRVDVDEDDRAHHRDGDQDAREGDNHLTHNLHVVQ